MAIQPRPPVGSHNPESQDLLQSLLEVPLTGTDTRLRPITLQSAQELRRHALRNYSFRTWVDTLLHRSELLLMLATLAVFGYWFVDGPLRDWLHVREQTAIAAPPPSITTHSQSIQAAAYLPYTSPSLPSAEAVIDYMAPGAQPFTEPVAVAQQPSRLIIPAIELDTPIKEVFIVDGVWEVAEYAAGYLHGTGLPGELGPDQTNTVLAGHAGLRGAVFGRLDELTFNDDVYLDAGGWRYHYRVRSKESVWPYQIEVLYPTSTRVLTLLTCTNWDTQRLVVVADLVGSEPIPSA